MARARNIKPSFFVNDDLGALEPLARLLFAGLWCLADREGRLFDKPKRIKVQILPYDDCDVDKLLEVLHEAKFIMRYSVDGERYVQVTNFCKHQNPHVNEKPSEIPKPPLSEVVSEDSSTSTVQVPEQHSTNPADSLFLDSLSLDSLNLIAEEAPNDITPIERLLLNTAKDIYPSVFQYARDLEFMRELTVKYPTIDLYEELCKWRLWLTEHKHPKNWRLAFSNWCKKAESFEKGGGRYGTQRPAQKRSAYADLVQS